MTEYELVKKWSAREPERCGPWRGEPHPHYPTAFFLARRAPRTTGSIHFTQAGEMQLGGDEELLFAVIEAIEARPDMRWRLDLLHGGTYRGWLISRGTSESYGGGATPATALLSAYLTALEKLKP